MGILGKLVGLGVAAVAGAVVTKIAKKYDENKKAKACSVDFVEEEKSSVVTDVKQATKDAYDETAAKVSEKVKTTAETIGIDTEEVSTAFGNAGTAAAGVGKAVAHASVAVANKVKEEAPIIIDATVSFVNETTQKVKDMVTPKEENIEDAEGCCCGETCECGDECNCEPCTCGEECECSAPATEETPVESDTTPEVAEEEQI